MEVGTIPLRLRLATPTREIRTKVVDAMRGELMRRLSGNQLVEIIRSETRKILGQALRAHDTYKSLTTFDGTLRRELGVVDGASAIEALVQAWESTIEVYTNVPRLVGGKLHGTLLSVRAIDASYEDVKQQTYAWYKTEKGDVIPWVDWLLTKGSEILITTHRVMVPNHITEASRTETNTIMTKTHGIGWGVPLEYAGTYEDNFATQAVDEAMPQIMAMFEAQILGRL